MTLQTCAICRRPHTSTRCPRCAALSSLHTPGTRVCVRVGHKWTEYADRVLVYFVDSLDTDTELILVWDVQADTYDEVPLLTARPPWTRPPTRDEQLDARDEVQRADRGAVLVTKIKR